MKFTQQLKSIFILLLLVSSIVVECIQITNNFHKQNNNHIKNSRKQHPKHRFLKKAFQKLKQTQSIQTNVYNAMKLSDDDNIDKQMQKLCKLVKDELIQSETTKSSQQESLQTEFTKEMDNLMKLVDQKKSDLKNQQQKLDKFNKDVDEFLSNLDQLRNQKILFQQTNQQSSNLQFSEQHSEKLNQDGLQDKDKDELSTKELNLRDSTDKSRDNLKHHISVFKKLQSFFKSKTNDQNQPNAVEQEQDSQTVDASQNLIVHTIAEAIYFELPQRFCWRKSFSLAIQCPDTHPFRSIGLCFQTCEQGQKSKNFNNDIKFELMDSLNICKQVCNLNKYPDCDTMALFIKNEKEGDNNLREWFIPDSITSFNKDVQCESTQKKFGAICYEKDVKTCDQIGYAKCGAGACALDKKNCANTVTTMVLQSLVGLLKFSLLFVAPGAAMIIELVQQALNYVKYLTHALGFIQDQQEILKHVNKNDILKNKLIDNTIKYIEGKIESNDGKSVSMDDIFKSQEITDKNIKAQYLNDRAKRKVLINLAVRTQIDRQIEFIESLKNLSKKEKIQQVLQAAKGFFDKDIISKLNKLVNKCTPDIVKDDNKNMQCVQFMTGFTTSFDPSGLITIANAFMYKQCDG